MSDALYAETRRASRARIARPRIHVRVHARRHVEGRGTSRLSLEQTTVHGFDFGMNALPSADLAGVFAFGSELGIDGSTVDAVAGANGGTTHALIGVAAGTHDMRVSDSIIDAWQGHHVLASGENAARGDQDKMFMVPARKRRARSGVASIAGTTRRH